MIDAYNEIKLKKKLILDCWRLSGLGEIIKQAQNSEPLSFPNRLDECTPSILDNNNINLKEIYEENDEEFIINSISQRKRMYKNEENFYSIRFEPYDLLDADGNILSEEETRKKGVWITKRTFTSC